MTLACFLFSHRTGELRGRDDQDRLCWICSRCGDLIPILAAQPITTGPAHQQLRDLGARTTKAKKVRDNVREWRISQR